MNVREGVPLGPLTSLQLGGEARRFVEASDEETLVRAVLDADARAEPVFVLGGGSNVVVGDAGFEGLVVHVASRGVQVVRDERRVLLDVAAGEPWDEIVARAVAEGWSGIESLSGIPGLAGATPIQNVGAYGQEVRETVQSVRVLDRRDGVVRELDASECRFAYRSSVFKGDDRYVVLRVSFALAVRPDSAPVRYAELARALGIPAGDRAPLGFVRQTVLGLRRGKGMVLDPGDPDSVSAGSFFVNPIVDGGALQALRERLAARGLDPAALPCFPEEHGRTKVSAAWLIERAGFVKGWGEGRAGISRKHSLALVNRGGATASELLAVAAAIQRGVAEAFGVALSPEPILVGV